MSEEQISTFHSMVSKARQTKKEEEEEEEKRKKSMGMDRIIRYRIQKRNNLQADQQGPGAGAVGGMLQGVGAQLMEPHPQPQVHPNIDNGAAWRAQLEADIEAMREML